MAIRETVPAIFGNADSKLRRVRALVNRARPAQAVVAGFELLGQPVMGQDLLHLHGRLQGFEVNKSGGFFGHGNSLVVGKERMARCGPCSDNIVARPIS